MASIEKIKNKKGEITSYRIVVSSGFDCNGRRVKHKLPWTPEPGMTVKQTEKALKRAAADFERSIEQGYQLDTRQTFSDYAAYFLALKEDNGGAASTVAVDKYLLTRILPEIGHLKLTDIRPQHLNNFYRKLRQPGQRVGGEKATAIVDLDTQLADHHISKAQLAEIAKISASTVTSACRGQTISAEKAKAISNALGDPTETLFSIQRDMRPLSEKNVREHHVLICAILAQAEKEILVPYNAGEKAQAPKYGRKEPNYFQPETITAILTALESEPLKWQLITQLLLVTGCRRGEIMGLHWSKVDFATGQVRIDRQLCYTKEKGIYETDTKTGNTRFVRLPTETLLLMKKFRAEQATLQIANGDRWKGGDYVFTQDDGSHMNPSSATAWLTKFSARHSLPHINPHAFRHSVASVLIANGTDIVTVSKQLGHSRISTTEDVYSHVIEEAKAKASETIADVMLRRKNG